jgi:hypothetical protein
MEDVDARAYEALAQHPRAADLAALARSVMTAAALTKRAEPDGARLEPLMTEMRLSRDEAATSFGNAIDVLQRIPQDDAERALACALAAHAVATQVPTQRADRDRTADELLWLALYTPFDATGLLDRALGDRATDLWDAFADRIRRIDQGTLPGLGRGEALVAALALASSSSKAAARVAASLAGEVRDRKLSRVLAPQSPSAEATPAITAAGDAAPSVAATPTEPLVGEMTQAPRSHTATALLAVTGILLAVHVVRLVARLALAYKTPAEVSVGDDGGVRVHWRTEMLGRTLRDRDVVVPRAALVQATREVRFPRLAFYAGLLALAVGSYLGVSAFIDGAKAASPSMLATGLVVIALGIALDFVLSSLSPGARGRCRVLFVPRAGSKLCVGGVDLARADAVIARLAKP